MPDLGNIYELHSFLELNKTVSIWQYIKTVEHVGKTVKGSLSAISVTEATWYVPWA